MMSKYGSLNVLLPLSLYVFLHNWQFSDSLKLWWQLVRRLTLSEVVPLLHVPSSSPHLSTTCTCPLIPWPPPLTPSPSFSTLSTPPQLIHPFIPFPLLIHPFLQLLHSLFPVPSPLSPSFFILPPSSSTLFLQLIHSFPPNFSPPFPKRLHRPPSTHSPLSQLLQPSPPPANSSLSNTFTPFLQLLHSSPNS